MTNAKTTKPPFTPSIYTNFGTVGQLQSQVRLLLGCSFEENNEGGVVLALAHAGLPRVGRDLEGHHFLLSCDAPFLVLAASITTPATTSFSI